MKATDLIALTTTYSCAEDSCANLWSKALLAATKKEVGLCMHVTNFRQPMLQIILSTYFIKSISNVTYTAIKMYLLIWFPPGVITHRACCHDSFSPICHQLLSDWSLYHLFYFLLCFWRFILKWSSESQSLYSRITGWRLAWHHDSDSHDHHWNHKWHKENIEIMWYLLKTINSKVEQTQL